MSEVRLDGLVVRLGTAGRKIDLYLGPIMSTSRIALACEGLEVETGREIGQN
jgi:hypothetical protein